MDPPARPQNHLLPSAFTGRLREAPSPLSEPAGSCWFDWEAEITAGPAREDLGAVL